jgi:hypothetical protein
VDDSIPAGLTWRKSSYSLEGNCVEVAADGPFVFLRDSKDPHGPVMRFEQARWREFLAAVRDGSWTA